MSRRPSHAQLEPTPRTATAPFARRLAAAVALSGALTACGAGAPTAPDATRPAVRLDGTTPATSSDTTKTRTDTTRATTNSGYQNPLV